MSNNLLSFLTLFWGLVEKSGITEIWEENNKIVLQISRSEVAKYLFDYWLPDCISTFFFLIVYDRYRMNSINLLGNKQNSHDLLLRHLMRYCDSLAAFTCTMETRCKTDGKWSSWTPLVKWDLSTPNACCLIYVMQFMHFEIIKLMRY